MYLRTLGALALEGETFKRQKPLLLLAYLVAEGSTLRRWLADVFWPSATDARDSLSTTVRRLAALGPGVIELGNDLIGTRLRSDVADLNAALAENDPHAVLSLYQGPFLANLDLPLGIELEEWLHSTRENLADHVRNCFAQAAHDSLAQNDIQAARAWSELALDVAAAPAWSAHAYYGLARVMRASHSPRIGELERQAGESDLAHDMRGAEAALRSPVVGAQRPGNAFIGRQRELAAIDDALGWGTTRLLTLHGPPGSGKSRLALEAAHRLAENSAFADGAYFVPLESIADVDETGSAIASCLGMAPAPAGPPAQHLARAIGGRRLLLVLDNFEHLLNATPLVAALVRSCPELRVMVTSRHALNLSEEHLLPVEGLPLEVGNSRGDATELLFERMRRHGTLDRVGMEDELTAAKVCRQLDGSPLAIELAASLSRVLPLGELAKELKRTDILASRDPTAAPRHRSLRTALDVSWNLLDEQQRRGLARLSVFRGGASRDAVLVVTAVGLPVLSQLIDASLVQLSEGGRYGCHPFISEYAASRLAEWPDDLSAMRHAHSSYYLGYVARHDSELLGGENGMRLAAWLDGEFANIQAAWSWAVAQGRHSAYGDTALALGFYAEMRGRYADVVALFEDALAANDETLSRGGDPGAPPRGGASVDSATVLALGNVLGAMSFVLFRLGRFDESLEAGLRCRLLLTGFDKKGSDWAVWAAGQGLALSSLSQGMNEAAADYALSNVRDRFRTAPREVDHERFRRIHDVTTGTSMQTLAFIERQQGNFEAALHWLRLASEHMERHQASFAGYLYWTLGMIHRELGQLTEAEGWLERGRQLVQELGFEHLRGYIEGELARVFLQSGRAVKAVDASARALQAALRSWDPWLETSMRTVHGLALLKEGDLRQAEDSLSAALESALASGGFSFGIEALIGTADTLVHKGRPLEAVSLLAFVSQSPHASGTDRAEARQRLADLAREVPEATFRDLLREGALLSPEDAFRAAMNVRPLGPRRPRRRAVRATVES